MAIYSDLPLEVRQQICVLAVLTSAPSTLFFDADFLYNNAHESTALEVIESRCERHPSQACTTALSLCMLNKEHFFTLVRKLDDVHKGFNEHIEAFVLDNFRVATPPTLLYRLELTSRQKLSSSSGFRVSRLADTKEHALRSYLSGTYTDCWTRKPAITFNRATTQLANLYEQAAEVEKLHHHLNGIRFDGYGSMVMSRSKLKDYGPFDRHVWYTSHIASARLEPQMNSFTKGTPRIRRGKASPAEREWRGQLDYQRVYLAIPFRRLVHLLIPGQPERMVREFAMAWRARIPELLERILQDVRGG